MSLYSFESNLIKLINFLKNINTCYEVIIIDDYSKDKSVEYVKKLQLQNDAIKLIRNPRNMGKEFSIKNGIFDSQGEYIIFTDIDMVFP